MGPDVLELFDRLPGRRVVVLGDVMLDRYVRGSVTRLSPEAAVPVVRQDRTWATPGGAGHVAACLAGLGARVTLAGLTGADRAADELADGLAAAGVEDVRLTRVPGARTTTKTRVLAGDRHQLLRLDDEGGPADWADAARAAGTAVAAAVGGFEAVVLADYEKGALPPDVLRAVLAAAAAAGVPAAVDPKKPDFSAYRGAAVLTPNAAEAERTAGGRLADDASAAGAAARLRAACGVGTVLITRGRDGMTGADADGPFHVPARVREVADVTGAGDTVVAVLAAALAAGLPVRRGCELAAVAAGIAVGRPGTYAPDADEVRAALGGASAKVLTPAAAARAVRRERARGRVVVFTNGCFDLLHPGHLATLQAAKDEGDYLVVGLNSDASVRRLKGPARPVLAEGQRAALLAGLACVDAVVVFDAPTPVELVRALAPDVLVKGGDYAPDQVVGGDLVRAAGGRVVVAPFVTGLSSSALALRLGRCAPDP